RQPESKIKRSAECGHAGHSTFKRHRYGSAKVSPDGQWVAYGITLRDPPRTKHDEPNCAPPVIGLRVYSPHLKTLTSPTSPLLDEFGKPTQPVSKKGNSLLNFDEGGNYNMPSSSVKGTPASARTRCTSSFDSASGFLLPTTDFAPAKAVAGQSADQRT